MANAGIQKRVVERIFWWMWLWGDDVRIPTIQPTYQSIPSSFYRSEQHQHSSDGSRRRPFNLNIKQSYTDAIPGRDELPQQSTSIGTIRISSVYVGRRRRDLGVVFLFLRRGCEIVSSSHPFSGHPVLCGCLLLALLVVSSRLFFFCPSLYRACRQCNEWGSIHTSTRRSDRRRF